MVGILDISFLCFPTKYTKYANVNEMMLMFNGIIEARSPFPIVRALHIAILSSGESSRLNPLFINRMPSPITNVIIQFSNNSPKKMIPRISVLNIDDNTKNETITNGVNRNPTYNNGNRFIAGGLYNYYILYIILSKLHFLQNKLCFIDLSRVFDYSSGKNTCSNVSDMWDTGKNRIFFSTVIFSYFFIYFSKSGMFAFGNKKVVIPALIPP